MNRITAKTIASLLHDESSAPAVTMYVPTLQAASPPNMSSNQITFKNMAREAQQQLTQRDRHEPFNSFFHEKCMAALDDVSFWQNLTEAMVILARPGMFACYHLPIASDAYVAVDKTFHLAPLIGLIQDMPEFYVLTVVQKHPELLRGDSYGLTATDIVLPASVETALNIDEMSVKNTRQHTLNSAGLTQGHGFGGAKESGDEERLMFFRLIDQVITKSIARTAPLILAGTEAEIAEYRHESKHPNILKQSIHGTNFDFSMPVLFEKALTIVHDEILDAAQQSEIERFEATKGQHPQQVAETAADIEAAARQGRVGRLLLSLYRLATNPIRQKPLPRLTLSRYNQSIEQLARKVLKQGGKVVNVYQDKAPQLPPALAIHRY